MREICLWLFLTCKVEHPLILFLLRQESPWGFFLIKKMGFLVYVEKCNDLFQGGFYCFTFTDFNVSRLNDTYKVTNLISVLASVHTECETK